MNNQNKKVIRLDCIREVYDSAKIDYQMDDEGRVLIPSKDDVVFIGAAVAVLGKKQNADTGIVTFTVGFVMLGSNKIIVRDFDASIFSRNAITELMTYGASLEPSAVDSIMRILARTAAVADIQIVSDNPGWKVSEDGQHYYLADKPYLLNDVQGTANPNRYDFHAVGSWNIVHDQLLEMQQQKAFMTLASLSLASIFYPYLLRSGAISSHGLLVSVSGVSSTGKTSGTSFALSLMGRADGLPGSLRQPWNGTTLSWTLRLANLSGVPLLFDELGTVLVKDLSNFVFALEAGTERSRATPDGTLREPNTWDGMVVFSTSETSIFSRMATLVDGLLVRIVEINDQITESAEQAEMLTKISRENYGHGLVKMMEYIEREGYDATMAKVLATFREKKEQALQIMVASPLAQRAASNFALVTAAAVAMKEAFNLPDFEPDDVLKYLVTQTSVQFETQDDAQVVYDKLAQWVVQHHSNIGVLSGREKFTPNFPVGYLLNSSPLTPEDEMFSIAILESELERFLMANNVANKTTIFKKFEERGQMQRGEGDRRKTRKVVEGHKLPLYILRFSRELLPAMDNLQKILDPAPYVPKNMFGEQPTSGFVVRDRFSTSVEEDMSVVSDESDDELFQDITEA